VKPPNRFAERTTILEQTFYRWKKKYGDMELADAKRLTSIQSNRVVPFIKAWLFPTFILMPDKLNAI